MARFIVKNKITNPEDIKDFDLDGYKFEQNSDDDQKFVYTRKSA